jgi:GTPase Era involved in 16S rRNA processing
MAQTFTAAAKQNPGRPGWLVEFRHPLKADAGGRLGKKTRKGLGTSDESEARRLVEELNQLLRDPSLQSIGAKATASAKFDPRVVDIFYSEIEPRSENAWAVRENNLPLPTRGQGYARVLLMGVPGAGKTTLIRQLIGSHPQRDRFPSTSVNRTTTFPMELVMKPGGYEAVTTFMSEHEARFEVEECVASAVIEGVSNPRKQVARAFLEKSDMRFRLKYLLGDIPEESTLNDYDPYEDDESSENDLLTPERTMVSSEEANVFQATVQSYLDRIMAISATQKASVEEALDVMLSHMPAEDRNAALDLIQEQAFESDEFIALVADILEELRAKFDFVGVGDFDKTTTGWPISWRCKADESERVGFIDDLRFFSGISVQSWGKLLTPLVNGMRVAGPFHPMWSVDQPRLVLFDTEGVGHKASATADLPDHVVSMLSAADVLLVIESAKNAMTNLATGKMLEAIVNAGQTQKLAVVFTHMDVVGGENLRGSAKFAHIFGGVRNVVENQVSKTVSSDASRYLLGHLEKSTFFLGKLDSYEARPARLELNKLLERLMEAQPPIFKPVAFPGYSSDKLAFAIQDAASVFREQWRVILGFKPHPDVTESHWQTIKALSRRYAEGWDDGFILQPTSNLLFSLSSAISKFLESPLDWTGNATDLEKRQTIDRIKALVNDKLPPLSSRRLRTLPKSNWVEAYSMRGRGSTLERRLRIEGIYERYVPVPDSRADKGVQEFLDEVKAVVQAAIEQVRQDVSKEQGTSP